MLCREIIAVCSEIHTKHINTLCGQNVDFVSVKPGRIYIVTAGLVYRARMNRYTQYVCTEVAKEQCFLHS
jgi:hypothetical protein